MFLSFVMLSKAKHPAQYDARSFALLRMTNLTQNVHLAPKAGLA